MVAPGVAIPRPLDDAGTPTYTGQLDVVERATAEQPTAFVLTDTATITGGPRPGSYSWRVVERVANGVLTITAWTLSPS